MPFVGFQATHRTNRLCCISKPVNKKGIKEFWNSEYLKDVRSKMINGEKIPECENCYRAEAQGKVSLRNHYNSLYKDLKTEDVPSAMDLDFSNLCNLQCIMCGPDRSSQWAKELGDKRILTFPKEQIKELCDISDKIKHLTIQGGEPSIMSEFEYYFDYLQKKKLIGNIEIDCISNLTNVNNRFYNLLEDFKSANLNASIDAFGLTNDYIRYPSNFSKIEQNLLSLSKRTLQINLQITLQVLCMFNFIDFLEWISKMHSVFSKNNKKLGINLFYVNTPEHLNVINAPAMLKEKMLEDLLKFQSQKNKIKDVKFHMELKNLTKLISNKLTDHKNLNRLHDYIKEIDHRRNIKITNYIPNFYKYT